MARNNSRTNNTNKRNALNLLVPETEYAHENRRERMTRALEWFCQRYRVRENWGENRGELVDTIVRSAGFSPGIPWCAATVTAFAKLAGYNNFPDNAARVAEWKRWAGDNGYVVARPQRGDIALWLNKDGTGHMGVVTKVFPGIVETIEGNTTPGESGNQRDGDGLYRRKRPAFRWKTFIRLPA